MIIKPGYCRHLLWICVAAGACSGSSTSAPATSTSSPTAPSAAPVTIARLDLAAASLNGGQSGQGTVTLSAAAPGGGTTVAISSSHPAVTVPAQLSVAAGATTATFTLATQAVSQAIDVSIHAAVGSDSRDAVLHLVPAPDLVGLDLLSPNVSSAGNVPAAVRLSAAPVHALDVTMSSANPVLTVPQTVSVPAGATSAMFFMAAQAVSAHTVIVVTARLNGVSRSATQTLTPRTLDTYFTYTSDPGDYIGGGRSARLSPPSSPISAGVRCDLNWFIAEVGSFTSAWNISMNAPPDQAMDYGTYTNATGNARVRGRAGLRISGEGRGCNTSTGTFTVKEIGWGPNNTVVIFKASFEQHCEGASAALRGEISVGSPPYYDNNMFCFVSSARLRTPPRWQDAAGGALLRIAFPLANGR